MAVPEIKRLARFTALSYTNLNTNVFGQVNSTEQQKGHTVNANMNESVNKESWNIPT